jgi:acyl carrier protein
MSELRDEILRIIAEVTPGSQIDGADDERSLYDAGLDSLDFSSVLMAIEDKYGFSFAEDDLDKVRSVADICRFVEKKRAA